MALFAEESEKIQPAQSETTPAEAETKPAEAETKPTEAETKPAKKKLGRPRKKNLWDRRVEMLRSTSTTPRDLFETDVFETHMPPGTRRHVGLLWISEIIERKHPPLTGWMQDLYQPVTPEVMEELGITVRTKDRTPEGVPKAGTDAVLYWAPKELLKEQDEILLRGNKPSERLHELEDEMTGVIRRDNRDGSGTFGRFAVSRDLREVAEVGEEDEGGMGKMYGPPTPIRTPDQRRSE